MQNECTSYIKTSITHLFIILIIRLQPTNKQQLSKRISNPQLDQPPMKWLSSLQRSRRSHPNTPAVTHKMSMFFRRKFDPIKCKHLLRLTIERIKVLKKKSSSHIQRLKNEIDLLLDRGHQDIATVKLEYLLREQNMAFAYDLIDHFCQVTIDRIPMIVASSHKECPAEMKEAIASLIYAAENCRELEELQKVKKIFKQKYGSKFVRAATELSVECGVNGEMIARLSALPPMSTYTKKILIEELIARRFDRHEAENGGNGNGEEEEADGNDRNNEGKEEDRTDYIVEDMTESVVIADDDEEEVPISMINGSSSPKAKTEKRTGGVTIRMESEEAVRNAIGILMLNNNHKNAAANSNSSEEPEAGPLHFDKHSDQFLEHGVRQIMEDFDKDGDQFLEHGVRQIKEDFDKHGDQFLEHGVRQIMEDFDKHGDPFLQHGVRKIMEEDEDNEEGGDNKAQLPKEEEEDVDLENLRTTKSDKKTDSGLEEDEDVDDSDDSGMSWVDIPHEEDDDDDRHFNSEIPPPPPITQHKNWTVKGGKGNLQEILRRRRRQYLEEEEEEEDQEQEQEVAAIEQEQEQKQEMTMAAIDPSPDLDHSSPTTMIIVDHEDGNYHTSTTSNSAVKSSDYHTTTSNSAVKSSDSGAPGSFFSRLSTMGGTSTPGIPPPFTHRKLDWRARNGAAAIAVADSRSAAASAEEDDDGQILVWPPRWGTWNRKEWSTAKTPSDAAVARSPSPHYARSSGGYDTQEEEDDEAAVHTMMKSPMSVRSNRSPQKQMMMMMLPAHAMASSSSN